jgi:hypothetical protein
MRERWLIALRPFGVQSSSAARVVRTRSRSGAAAARSLLALSPRFAAREMPSLVVLEDQHHALGARQLGRLLDQERVDVDARAELVEAQSRVDQPLEGRLRVRVDGKVGMRGRRVELAASRFPGPRGDQRAVHRQLVEVVAAQPFVAQAGDGVDHRPVGELERLAGLADATVGEECIEMRAQHRHRLRHDRAEVVRGARQEARGAARRRERLGGPASRQEGERLHPHRVDDHEVVAGFARFRAGTARRAQCVRCVALQECDARFQVFEVAAKRLDALPVDLRAVVVEVAARERGIADVDRRLRGAR